MSIQTKISAKPRKELSSKPSKIASVLEDNCAKRIPAQHTIITSWTKVLKYRWNRSQEYLRMYNNKFHPLEPQSRLVVEEDRV